MEEQLMLLHDEMIIAGSTNHVTAAQQLLDGGADINAANERGETVFSYACANDALALTRMLYERGANVNTIGAGGGSPLDWAVGWASFEFREWLKSIGGKRRD